MVLDEPMRMGCFCLIVGMFTFRLCIGRLEVIRLVDVGQHKQLLFQTLLSMYFVPSGAGGGAQSFCGAI